MFRRSLRFRLTVLSTLLFGLLLIGVTIAAWRTVYRIQIKRVDDLLAQNVIRELGSSPTPVQWRSRQRNASTWPAMLLRYPMLAIARNGDTVFISPSWPDEMATTGYTLPEGAPLLRRQLLGPHVRPLGPLMTLTAVLPSISPEDLADAPFRSPQDAANPASDPPPPAPDSLEADLQASTVGRVATNPDSLPPDQRWVDPFAPPADQPPIAWTPPTGPLPDPFAASPSEAVPIGPVASDPFGPISIAPEPVPDAGALPVIDPAAAATSGLSSTGEATSTLPLPRNLQRPNGPPPLRNIDYHTRNANGNTWRVAVGGNAGITLVILSDLSPIIADMDQLRGQLLIISLVCLAFVALLSWFIIGHALRPAAVLSDSIERLTAQGLDQRLPSLTRNHEFERLVNAYNEMLNRLETSFMQARRFSADAAHELRTPLTILQGELEHALHQAPAGSREQETLGSLLDEVQRLKVIVQQLLLLSRADSGRLRLNLEPLNLSHAVEMIVEDLEMLAPHLRLKTRIPPGVMINCEPILLRQVIQNLVTNAIRYNLPHREVETSDDSPATTAPSTDPNRGCIVVRLNANSEQARLAIANSGVPIPAEDHERIFERFYRGDMSRNRAIDGTGLGLSLCYEILRSHRGSIRLGAPDESEVDPIHGRLITFIVHLPVSPIPIGDSGLRPSSVPAPRLTPVDKPPASGPTPTSD